MDTRMLLSSLKLCANSKLLNQGKLIHQKIVSLGLQTSIPLCNSLISLYVSCHLYESAELVFQIIETPSDISLWNNFIAAHAKNYTFAEALKLFERLLQFPLLKPDRFTYPSVLKACGGLGQVRYGKCVHTSVIKSGFVSDVVLASSLVGMYAKCGLFECAVKVFDGMPERDVACWNNVISCYYQSGQYEKTLDVFEEMKVLGFKPDSVTLTTIISSCARLSDLEMGIEIHKALTRIGFPLDDYVSAALVDMYGKCGFLEMAKDVFEQIPRKSVVAYNSMIAGYSLKGRSTSCIELFQRMLNDGAKPTLTTLSSLLMACSRSAELCIGKFIHGYLIKHRIEADIFIHSSLIDLYFKCGNVKSAEIIFKQMPKTGSVSWNVMISGYVAVGHNFEALRTFNDMREAGVMPDAITFTSVLPACSQLAALEEGKEIHKCIVESKCDNSEIVMGALLDMYAKCGAVEEARCVFNQLPERDFVSWTSMIMAYGSHGQGFEAIKLFHLMQQSETKPDRVTFLALMSACSHSGLVDEGQHFFNLMKSEYGIKPTMEHYSCLIDLLGRAGRLHEAFNILLETPELRKDLGLLSTLLSACRLHRELELGEEIAKLLIDMDPEDTSTYIILSNMYASANNWDAVRGVRIKMKELGLKKNPGCSWIEVDKRIQPFFSEKMSPPLADMVSGCLAMLASHMEKDDLL